jgi:hypothetical protein
MNARRWSVCTPLFVMCALRCFMESDSYLSLLEKGKTHQSLGVDWVTRS